MPQVVNPELEVVIYASAGAFSLSGIDIDFDVTKDLDEEPNECELTVYNQKEGTRDKVIGAANESAPVQVLGTPAGKTQIVTMYKGELDFARSAFMKPGHETIIKCLSEQLNHRARYIEKEYKAETKHKEILNELIDIIGLPRGEIDLWFTTNNVSYDLDGGILLSQTFAGPAFPLLKRYCHELGYYCYILDGQINITSVYEPTQPRIIEIPDYHLLSTPEPTSVTDALAVEMKTIVEATGSDPFEKASKKPKKKRKIKVPLNKGESIYVTMPDPVPHSDDYTEYEAVDMTLKGMNFDCRMLPGIQPDNLVKTPSQPNRLFRVTEVNHHGNNRFYDEWGTMLTTYEYEDQTGVLDA